MDTMIVITNKRRVSNLLGIELFKNKEFEKEYSEYLNSTTTEKFNEFYNKTGLKLANVYNLKESYKKKAINSRFFKNSRYGIDLSDYMIDKISFNSLGSSIDSPFEYDIYGQDIIILHKVDEIWIRDDKVIIDGKEVYTLNINKEVIDLEDKLLEIRYDLSFAKNIEDKIKIIRDNYASSYEFKEGIKQIYLSSFGELFVLYEDGLLYMSKYGSHETIKYAENVSGIWEANAYNCYLVFKNNYVEFLTSRNFYYHEKTYDKVIFNNNYIAFLKDKELEVISKGEDMDNNYHVTFGNVDNIELGDYEHSLKMWTQDKCIICSTNIWSECYE